jgi:hypothetical protein
VKSALGSLSYSDTCSIDPIIASSFSFSRKSRSSYPYMLSKPVFGPRPDYNLSWQLSHALSLRSVCIWRGLVLRLALVFFRCDLFLFGGAIFGRGVSFLIVSGHGFPNVDLPDLINRF